VSILIKLLATLGLVALNAYFVAAEFAAVGARASRIESAGGKNLISRLCLDIKRRLDLYLSSCQLGVTLASLGLGAVTEPLLANVFSPVILWLRVPSYDILALSFTLAMAVSTSLHIIVGEQAPKNWAIRYADALLPILAPGLFVFTYLLYPFIWLLNAITNRLLKLTGAGGQSSSDGAVPHTEEELRALLMQAVAYGSIPKGKGRLLTSAFDFGELKVRQIMTPRPRVDFLSLNQPIDQVLRIVQKSEYTRLPLCEGDIDHIIGLVHMKDLFTHLKLVPGKLKFLDEITPEGQAIAIPTGKPGSAVHVIGSGELNLKQIRRDVLFVPELLLVPRLLRQMQTSHIHMAVVVDEYGSTQGIVTLEDVLEEIVGEIEDEFDPVSRGDFVKDGDNIRVNGLYPLHELRDRLPLPPELDSTGVDTVGGYITQKLNRWPRPGDVIRIGDFNARVISVQQRRVGQVLLSPAAPLAGADAAAG
jgi:CBS domain containing-hemolysin-like protein